MILLYQVLLYFKIIATIACAVYCFLIARFKLTPTFTYIAFGFAFVIILILQIESLYFSQSILGFLAKFNFIVVFQSDILSALYSGLFLIGFARKYYALVIIYKLNKQNEIKTA